MAFKKLFNYNIFEKKICNNEVYASLTTYYKAKYPNLKKSYIKVFIEYISTVLIEEFIGITFAHRFNTYCLIYRILTNPLNEEELERISWRRGLMLLQECKELTKDFIENILKEHLNSNFELSMVTENLHDYVKLIEELLGDRLYVILSYIHNYLTAALKEEMYSNQLSLPPLLELLSGFNAEVGVIEKPEKNKHIQFFENVPENTISNSKKNTHKKRKHEEILISSDDMPHKKLA